MEDSLKSRQDYYLQPPSLEAPKRVRKEAYGRFESVPVSEAATPACETSRLGFDTSLKSPVHQFEFRNTPLPLSKRNFSKL